MATPKKVRTPVILDPRYMPLDVWQKQVIRYKGNVALRCGRQTGKSTAVALKARSLANEYNGSTTLILAPSIRQSSLLYEKVRAMLEMDNLDVIKEKLGNETFSSQLKKNEAYREAGIFLDKEPTKTRIRLKNGSQIICEACGETGAKIRGFTVDFLIVDEAQLIPRPVWVAIIPMMATSKKRAGTGWSIILGTPHGKGSYYYDCFHNSDYKHVHVKSEQCRRTGKSFLAKEKRRLTENEFNQEYNAEFIEAVSQYFSSELVDSCVCLKDKEALEIAGKRYLGVDLARYGGDDNAYCETILNKDTMNVVWADTQKGESVVVPMGLIKNRHNTRKYTKIFIDSGGLGGSVLDILQAGISKYKVIGLDNSQRRVQDGNREKKVGILKEDLYSNAKLLMEQGRLKMVKNPYLISGLKGISFKYSAETGKVKISGRGRGQHLVEAFVRALWGIKDRGRRIYYG